MTFAAGTEYVRRCFGEYGLDTDASGEYASMYKPYHLIGLELGVTVASVGLRSESTGAALAWHGDVVATAKRDLKAGETLDGEGGYCVYGKLMSARDSMAMSGLPLGLAHGIKLKNPIKAGDSLSYDDVVLAKGNDALEFRRRMEQELGPVGLPLPLAARKRRSA